MLLSSDIRGLVTLDFGRICCKIFSSDKFLKILDMRVLVLTLMMSFLSHSAFGTSKPEGASSCNRGDIPSICSMPENIESLILEYLSLKDLCCRARLVNCSFEKAANQVFSMRYGEPRGRTLEKVVIRPLSLTTPPNDREGAEEERQRISRCSILSFLCSCSCLRPSFHSPRKIMIIGKTKHFISLVLSICLQSSLQTRLYEDQGC
jgi:hypothetical protein